MLRRAFVAVCACLALSLTGCGGDSTSPGGSNVVGTYTLQTVNGGTLPYSTDLGGGILLRITAGRITLNADRTFSTAISYEVRQGTSTSSDTDTDNGTYEEANGAVRMTFGDGTQIAGTVSGNTFSLSIEGDVFVFRR